MSGPVVKDWFGLALEDDRTVWGISSDGEQQSAFGSDEQFYRHHVADGFPLQIMAGAIPRLPVDRSLKAAHVPPGLPQKWKPPAEALRLNRRQREALGCFIAEAARANESALKETPAASVHPIRGEGSERSQGTTAPEPSAPLSHASPKSIQRKAQVDESDTST